jgi:uncharacterized protein (DUF1499 family)
MSPYLKYGLIPVVIVVVMFIITRVGVFSGKQPSNLGVTSGRLAPCPESPNCVSTQAVDTEHAIEPLPIRGTVQQSQDILLAVINAIPRTNVVIHEPDYVYVEFKTGIMMYTDDVEFWFDERAGVIHFRSASRLGYSDLGLNRRRMESIRGKYIAGLNES